MKRFITSNSGAVSSIEYEDNLPNETYVLAETEGNGIVDEWGDCMVWCEDCNIGLEYNLCIDNTTGEMLDESAFYVMHYIPDTDYWETDSSDFTSYHIDYSNPNWRLDIKEFAISLLKTKIER